MAETKKESSRQARQAHESGATAVQEAAREMGEGAERQREAVEEAGHRVQRLGERQSEAFQRTVQLTAEATQRLAGGAEAMSRSGTALAKALQEVSRVWIELTQDTMKHGIETAELLMRCRNIGDVMHAHSEYMRNSFDTFLDRGVQISDISTRILAMATQPIAARMGMERGMNEDGGQGRSASRGGERPDDHREGRR